MWNPCVRKKKRKKTLLGNRNIKGLFLSHQWGTGYSWCYWFKVRRVFFFPLSYMIAPISVSWAPKRNERHTSTKPPAVTDSHLWANAYTKMNRGREKWRQTGAEAFCFPPRCCDLTWARRRWYICSPAKLASLRLSDSTGIHVVWQGMHKQQEIWG